MKVHKEYKIRAVLNNGFAEELVSAKSFGDACLIIDKMYSKRLNYIVGFALISVNGIKQSSNENAIKQYLNG